MQAALEDIGDWSVEIIKRSDTARVALEKLAEREFDVVLLDIEMPELDGYGVLEKVKSDMRLRDIPVIMITAVDDLESVVKCIEMGAADYLPKPFNPVLLRARLGACLEQKRMRDQEKSHVRQIQEEKKRADDLLERSVIRLKHTRSF